MGLFKATPGRNWAAPVTPWATPQLPLGPRPLLGCPYASIGPPLGLPCAILRMPWAALMPQEGCSWAATLLPMGLGQPLGCPLVRL